MDNPRIRPGLLGPEPVRPRLLARFTNAAHGNLAIQWLVGLGIPSDQIGVVPPESLEGGQGMVLAIGCPDESLVPRIEAFFHKNGARVVHAAPAPTLDAN